VSLGDLFDARAFALGMVALVNPCGFALLPAYLGYFLGMNDGSQRGARLVALNRAQVVGLSLSLGFLAVFGTLGLALAGVMTALAESGTLAWITLVIGIGLVALGIAMLRGFQPMLSLPKLDRGGGSRSVAGMFLFGVSYALASLTCSIHLFIAAVSAGAGTFGERLGGFVSYGVGMGLLATGLTLAAALGRQGLVNRFRRLLPHINLISALILVVVGAYVAWYGYWSTDPIGNPAGPVLWVDARQSQVSGWIDDRTAVLGWGFLAVNLALLTAGLVARNLQRPAAHATS
jgi:cytochrome c biogenesis protein CcdA